MIMDIHDYLWISINQLQISHNWIMDIHNSVMDIRDFISIVHDKFNNGFHNLKKSDIHDWIKYNSVMEIRDLR